MEFCILLLATIALIGFGNGEHHMKYPVAKRQDGDRNVPLVVANWCANDIYPGIITQGGTGPDTTGFHLSTGANQTINVSSDWQGRIWGRTNCSFGGDGSAQGQSCDTGDCGGSLQCEIAGAAPATLAEFTLDGSQSQSFYDISLVDGYNLPMAIVLLSEGVSELEGISGSTTNPSCIASVGDLADQNFNPYSGGQQFLGTSSNNPLPFETKNSASTVEDWCPWDLQVDAPLAPGNGIYPYPDGNVQRPIWDPCLSACAKYSEDQYCCTGNYDGPSKCQSNYYSKAAKSVCPDAYSYAYDDQDSTFSVPKGGGFQVIFCPGGRSTNILATQGQQSSGSSSTRSNFTFRAGWLVIDGKLIKAALAAVVAVVSFMA